MPSVAFAGVLVTLGSQKFVLEFKIHLSERSEFVFWTLLLTNLCKPGVTGSETATEGIWLLARHLAIFMHFYIFLFHQRNHNRLLGMQPGFCLFKHL